MQRRKKKPEEESTAVAQAPLQPAYFESGAPVSEGPSSSHQPEAAEKPAPRAKAQPEAEGAGDDERQPDSNEAAAPAAAGEPARRPQRRRGRGGRGRSSGRAREAGPVGEVDGNRVEGSPAASPEPAAMLPLAVKGTPTPPPHASKGTVVLAIGLPGSGKSSWFKRNNVTPLSSDMLRSLLFDDPTEQRFQDLIFSNLRSMLKARLIARRPMNYVDTTNLTPQERQHWIKLARDYGYEVAGGVF